jgi:hypothetical protein
MKRRKKAPIGHALKSPHAASKHAAPDDILPILTEQAGQAEIREKAVAAGARRRNGKSRQPPLSEEMKTVTEIGSRRWKPGQTQ